MSLKSRITVGVGALLALLSITSYAADTPNFGAYQTTKDAQNKPIGLGKGEGVVKDAPATTPTLGPVEPPSKSSGAPVIGITQSTSTWGGPSLGDLEKIRSENAMLAEQLKNAELKKKISDQGGLANFSGSNLQPSASTTRASGGPRVVMIAGGEGNYRANILMPTGQSITASNGTNIPGFGVVSAITPDAVQFGSGKAKRSIPLVTNGANADFVIAP